MPSSDPAPSDAAAAADAVAAAAVAALAPRTRAIPLPSGALPGWSSLCAEEYVRAARSLQSTVLAAADALAAAGRP